MFKPGESLLIAGADSKGKQPVTLTFTPKFRSRGANSPALECIWEESTQREATQTRGEEANSTQESPSMGCTDVPTAIPLL